MGVIIAIAAGAAVAIGLAIWVAMQAKRQGEREIPELNKHPERLEQMLDQSDDA